MDRIHTHKKIWFACSVLSLLPATIALCLTYTFESQFGSSKLAVAVIGITVAGVGILLVLIMGFYVREIMGTIIKHWSIKAIVMIIFLAVVTILNELMKYPRFRLPKMQEEKNSKQGHTMEFVSAVCFSLFAFSTSIFLAFPEEYGLFAMCIELTMQTALEIPGIGGSIVNGYYVWPTAFYCLALIVCRCYIRSKENENIGRNRRADGGGGGGGRGGGGGGGRPHLELVPDSTDVRNLPRPSYTSSAAADVRHTSPQAQAPIPPEQPAGSTDPDQGGSAHTGGLHKRNIQPEPSAHEPAITEASTSGYESEGEHEKER